MLFGGEGARRCTSMTWSSSPREVRDGESSPTRSQDAGGAQGHLMRCSDGHFYVVKFRNNPQHLRVLANELLATRLAEGAQLPVPATEVVEVGDWLVQHTPELNIQLAGNTIPLPSRDCNLARNMWSARWRDRYWIIFPKECSNGYEI